MNNRKLVLRNKKAANRVLRAVKKHLRNKNIKVLNQRYMIYSTRSNPYYWTSTIIHDHNLNCDCELAANSGHGFNKFGKCIRQINFGGER